MPVGHVFEQANFFRYAFPWKCCRSYENSHHIQPVTPSFLFFCHWISRSSTFLTTLSSEISLTRTLDFIVLSSLWGLSLSIDLSRRRHGLLRKFFEYPTFIKKKELGRIQIGVTVCWCLRNIRHLSRKIVAYSIV